MQPASKQDEWAQESLFSDTGVFPWLLVSVPAGTHLSADEAHSEQAEQRGAGILPTRECPGRASHLFQGTPAASSSPRPPWDAAGGRGGVAGSTSCEAGRVRLPFLRVPSPPHTLEHCFHFIFTSRFCNGFTTSPVRAWQRRGARTAVPGSPCTSQTRVRCRHMKGMSFDPTNAAVYLNQCQCSRFTQSSLIQSHHRTGGPVVGWPLVCLNRPAGAWGRQNLPGECDKCGRLEGTVTTGFV